MSVDLVLAKLGPEMESAILAEWLVSDGDVVRRDQPVATVETDKVTSDVQSPADGTIGGLATPGEEYPVGAVLATIVGADDGAQPAPRAVDVPVAETPPDVPAHAVAVTTNGADRPDRAALTRRRRGEPLATPVARRMAQSHGITLAELTVAPPGRVIRKCDVQAALDSRGSIAASATPALGRSVALTPMRRRIAANMHRSLQETAQITDFREHDVTGLVELRAAGVRWAAQLGFRVTFTDLLVRAAALALREVPELNVSPATDDGIVQHDTINIGVAVALPDGLIVPVLHRADELTLAQVHERVDALVTRARSGTLGLEDLSGGTFTVTNIGSYGSHMATPILVPGQVGILATGSILDRPVVRDGQLVVGKVMHTSLTIDHRLVDGETAGRFQTVVGSLLENPERLL